MTTNENDRETWNRFYFAALAGTIAQRGLPKAEGFANMLKDCAGFADDALKEIERGKSEPQYQMLILGGRR